MLPSKPWLAILPRGFGWGALALVSQGLGQWIVAALIARSLGATALGDFAFAWAVATPVLLALGFQLRALQINGTVPGASLADFLSLRLMSVAMAVVVVCCACLVMRWPSGRPAIIILLTVSRGFEFIHEIVHANWIRCEEVERYGRSMLARNFVGIVGVSLAIASDLSLLGVCLALSLCSGISLMADLLPERALARAEFRRPIIDAILRKGLPLTAAMLMLSVQPLIPRYLLDWHLGPTALGVFAAISYLPMSAAVLVRAYGDTSSARISQYYAGARYREAHRLLRNSVLSVATAGVIGCVLLWSFGEPVLNLIFGSEVGAHATLLIALGAAEVVAQCSSLFGYAATAAGLSVEQLTAAFVGVFAAFIASWFLIPRYGLWGAAGSVAIANTALLAGFGWLIWRLPERKEAP